MYLTVVSRLNCKPFTYSVVSATATRNKVNSPHSVIFVHFFLEVFVLPFALAFPFFVLFNFKGLAFTGVLSESP